MPANLTSADQRIVWPAAVILRDLRELIPDTSTFKYANKGTLFDTFGAHTFGALQKKHCMCCSIATAIVAASPEATAALNTTVAASALQSAQCYLLLLSTLLLQLQSVRTLYVLLGSERIMLCTYLPATGVPIYGKQGFEKYAVLVYEASYKVP